MLTHGMRPDGPGPMLGGPKSEGRAGRSAIEQKFSMEAMVAAYQGAYDKLLHRPGATPKH